MANPAGHSATLVARQDGNQNGFVHGVYAQRRDELPEKARDVAEALLALPHVTEADSLAAIEVGRLTALIDNIDNALSDGRVENRRGEARALYDLRRRFSSELRSWLGLFGATPRNRADWARQLAEGGLAAEIARRRSDTT